jgi:hypothetical protein
MVMAEELMRQFEQRLADLRHELLRNLNNSRPLNLDSASRLVDVFNSRLVTFQHEFLSMVATIRGNVTQKIAGSAFEIPESAEKLPQLKAVVAGVVAALVTWFAMTHLVAGYSSSWWNPIEWIWPRSVTLAEMVGKWIGQPPEFATLAVTLLAAVAVFYLVRRLTAGWEDRRLYRSIIRQFDEIIAPELRNWARSVIRD